MDWQVCMLTGLWREGGEMRQRVSPVREGEYEEKGGGSVRLRVCGEGGVRRAAACVREWKGKEASSKRIRWTRNIPCDF